MEKEAHQVANYELCGHCYNSLVTRGHVELDGRFMNRCNWLYPDGSVVRMLVYADGTAKEYVTRENKEEGK